MQPESNTLSLLFRSGSRLIQIVSYEWERVHGFVFDCAKSEKMNWFSWSNISGLKKWDSMKMEMVTENADLTDPMEVLHFYNDAKVPLLLVLEDFHPYLTKENYQVIRFLRELSRTKEKKALILSQPIKRIPEDLSKEMALIEVDLPKQAQLNVIAETVSEDYPGKTIEISDKLLSSALGLTVTEAKLAFSKALNSKGRLTESEIPLIIAEKENVIKKNGLLEYYHPSDSLNSIGGLENLKDWVQKRGKAFDLPAREYGLNLPKGLLLLGVPGCGKSLTAKVIAKTWNFPLLRFDLGKVFGGIVGESERNIREALDVARALSPCVLWIDEIEKGLSGAQSSGMTDGGTTSRVFGTFLTWMQEKKEPVFVVATANDISMLPPELLRKGRFDEIFFVDLPTLQERENIFKIHIEKKGRSSKNFDLKALAVQTVGFTGAEIEEAINEGLFLGFNQNREVTSKDILECISKICPLSKTMAENITNLRKWSKTRARSASIAEAEPLVSPTDNIPKLKQEARNPFIE